eukprot:1904399-Karenia_brevis.AAC.1
MDRPDPAEGAQARLQKLGCDIWKSIVGEDVSHGQLAAKICAADAQQQDTFFEKWSTYLWDVKAVYAATDLYAKPKSMSLRVFVHQTTERFYSKLLAGQDSRTPRDAQAQIPLKAMAPAELAAACQRVAVGYGLPPDGHV